MARREHSFSDELKALRMRRLSAAGQAIRQLREENHLTQAELAETVGVDRATIIRTEQGKHGIDLTLMWELADALGLSFAQLSRRIETTADKEPSSDKAPLHRALGAVSYMGYER